MVVIKEVDVVEVEEVDVGEVVVDVVEVVDTVVVVVDGIVVVVVLGSHLIPPPLGEYMWNVYPEGQDGVIVPPFWFTHNP